MRISFCTSPTVVDIIGQLHAKASLTIIGPVSDNEVTSSKSDAFNIKLISCFPYPFNSTSLQLFKSDVADQASCTFFILLSNAEEKTI